MTMMLALVMPVSLISVALSVVSISRSIQSAYELGNNGFSFYLDEIALRHELGDIDVLSDFPSTLAQNLVPLYWDASSSRQTEGHGGNVYVSLDGKQAYLVRKDGSWAAVDEPFSSLCQAGNQFLWEKRPELFQVLVTFPYHFALRHAPVWYWMALVISLLTFLFCPLLYNRLKHNILNPMQIMTEAMDAFRGNQSYRIPPQSESISDDFLRLFSEFNEMAVQVQASHEKDVKLLETEMDNLRLQVNPHMLLNSYNMIYALAESKNYATIQDYTLCLADYFRYVLRRGQQMVTVKQELEFVDNFIRIQRIRFPGRFSYVYQAEEDCMSAFIPPLLIENFVENAIKYALNPKEPIEIVVSVRREENEAGKDTLHIAIMDTGSGIRPEVLEKLQKKEPYIDEAGQKHIGIYNCLRRVELFYGDAGDIHFSSAVGGGTQVYLIIPFSLSADRGTGWEARA